MLGRLGFVAVTFALVSWPGSADACTPPRSLTADVVVSPLANTYLGTMASLLLKTTEGAPARLRVGASEPIELGLSQAFRPLRPLEPRLGFFRPARELEAEQDYVVETEDGKWSVPFRTSTEAPRVLAHLDLSVASRAVAEQALTSATCYSGPLQDRPFTRVADIVVHSEPAARLVASVTTLDSVSGELIEDVALLDGESAEGRLELPLPAGVAECLRVRVLDYAGTVLTDEHSLCVVPAGVSWSVDVDVFEPRSAPAPAVPEDEGDGGEPTAVEPPGPKRTSRGCQFSHERGGAWSLSGIFVWGWLLRSRRRFRALNEAELSVTLGSWLRGPMF